MFLILTIILVSTKSYLLFFFLIKILFYNEPGINVINKLKKKFYNLY